MACTGFRRIVSGCLAWFVLLGATAARLHAIEPEVRNFNVRGLQVGGTTTLTIDGDDLGTAPRLLLPFPAVQKLKTPSTPKQATWEVSLAGDVPPGFYPVRVATEGGVSLPAVFAVDRLPQRPLAPTVDALPVALHGSLTGSTVVETRFPGKAGQKVIVQVDAQRPGSRLRPVLHLIGPGRKQLAWAWSTPALGGDTRLEATLPEGGTWTVTLHDVEYAGQAPGNFRLAIGQWSFVDQVFPPVVGKETRAVELIGSGSVRVDLPPNRDSLVMPLPWPSEGTWSGPRPFVQVSRRTEIVEHAATGKVQDLPAGPVGVSGRLLTPGEEDRYRVPVKPGSRIRFEVFAERLGSPIDVALVVRNEMGGQLARVEDSPGTLDPILEYAVPAKVTSVIVGVEDAQGQGGPRGIYRLVVDPLPLPSRGDFRLHTPARRVNLASGGRNVIPILLERRSYQGSVQILADRLPPGVKLEGATIPANADGTLLTVERPAGAAAGEEKSEALLLRWRGRSEDGQERPVLLQGDPLERVQPWLAEELPLATTTTRGADFQIDWRKLPADIGLAPAGKLVLPVTLTRPAASPAVRLTLLTSQVPVLVNRVPDPNQTLRLERPIEVAAKATEADPTLLIPAQLAGSVYDVAIQAEWLSPDRRAVLATATTPVRRLEVRLPVEVVVEGSPRFEVKADPKTGSGFEIKGRVERRPGVTGDVALTVTGLPPGGRADGVTVKAGVSTFSLKVILPPTLPPGELPALKLAGTVAPDPKQPGVRVRSREVDLTVVVQPTKPG
jgi:hypothetical protein